MLLEALFGEVGLTEFIVFTISSLIVIFLTLPVHEFAHAFAASKCGDNTAKFTGRLTVNPFAHIDWFGAACILCFGFGWAKPVPINSRNLRRGKLDVAITAFAGPLSNLILGFISTILMYAFLLLSVKVAFADYLFLLFMYVAIININLAVFNLIPIPPLDGSKILAAILPNSVYYKLMLYERYLSIILFALLFSDAFSSVIGRASDFIFGKFFYVVDLIFSIFM